MKTLKTEARRRHRREMAAQMNKPRSLAIVRKLKECVYVCVNARQTSPISGHVGGPDPLIKCVCVCVVSGRDERVNV